MSDNSKIEHIGLWAKRCNDGSPSGDQEAIFADEWRKANEPASSVNCGIGALTWLLHCELRDTVFGGKDWQPFPERLTQHEAEVAATVVQWMGTSCGFSFLQKCLERCGYKLVRPLCRRCNLSKQAREKKDYRPAGWREVVLG